MADLPKSVGPGPLELVLKEALGLLVNVAYKSCRALKEIQLDGTPNPYMTTCVLKAKYVNNDQIDISVNVSYFKVSAIFEGTKYPCLVFINDNDHIS